MALTAPSQNEFYSGYRFLLMDGTLLLPQLIKWPELSIEIPTNDVALDSMFIVPITTGMRKLPAYEFTFSNYKGVSAPINTVQSYFQQNKSFAGMLIETDQLGDPTNPASIVMQYDLGKCRFGAPKFPAGEKMNAPVAEFTVMVFCSSMLPTKLQ